MCKALPLSLLFISIEYFFRSDITQKNVLIYESQTQILRFAIFLSCFEMKISEAALHT